MADVHSKQTAAESSACGDSRSLAPVSAPRLRASVFPVNNKHTNFEFFLHTDSYNKTRSSQYHIQKMTETANSHYMQYKLIDIPLFLAHKKRNLRSVSIYPHTIKLQKKIC